MPAARTPEVMALLLGLLAAPAALAQTECRLAAGPLAFGAYNVFDPLPRDTHATLQLSCTRHGGPQHLVVSVAIGPGGGGSTAQRALRRTGGPERLAYQLFRDATRTAVWGDTPGLDTLQQPVSVPNNNRVDLDLTLFARIPAGQDATPGLYSDTLTVSVTP